MKYFNKDGKYNWVDENNTFVGYDSYRGWCEAYGWIVNPTILSTDEIYDVDGAESIEPDTELEDYNFDTSFFQRSNPDKYNWVDENNTFVGYDSYRGWCEAD